MKKLLVEWKSMKTSDRILAVLHPLLVIAVTVAALLSQSTVLCGPLTVVLAILGVSQWKENKLLSLFYFCNAIVIAVVSILLW